MVISISIDAGIAGRKGRKLVNKYLYQLHPVCFIFRTLGQATGSKHRETICF